MSAGRCRDRYETSCLGKLDKGSRIGVATDQILTPFLTMKTSSQFLEEAINAKSLRELRLLRS